VAAFLGGVDFGQGVGRALGGCDLAERSWRTRAYYSGGSCKYGKFLLACNDASSSRGITVERRRLNRLDEERGDTFARGVVSALRIDK
jgi:hypothetical protein